MSTHFRSEDVFARSFGLVFDFVCKCEFACVSTLITTYGADPSNPTNIGIHFETYT